MSIRHRSSYGCKPKYGVIPMGDAINLDKISWCRPNS